MAEDDGALPLANRRRGLDVDLLANREHGAADEPDEGGDCADPDRDHDVLEPHAQHRDQRERQQEAGEGQEDVGESLDDQVRHPAAEPRNRPERNADREPEADGQETDQEREPPPVEESRQQVASEVVGAERVQPGDRPERLAEVLALGILWGQRRRGQRQAEERQEQQEAGGGGPVAPEAPPAPEPVGQARPVPGPRLLSRNGCGDRHTRRGGRRAGSSG